MTALMLITLFLFAMVNYTQYKAQSNITKYMERPITDIFSADVYVPDMVAGDNPLLIYNRIISEPFIGDFTVEVKDELSYTECVGFGNNIAYDPEDKIDPKKTTFKWFLDNQKPVDCYKKLSIGSHYMIVNYTIKNEGYPDRYYTTKSNIFKVYPRSIELNDIEDAKRLMNYR